MSDLRQTAWRYAARPVTLMGADARSILGFLVWMIHMRLWTFILAIAAVIFFAVVSRMGYTVPVFFRRIMRILRGRVVYARPWWYVRRYRANLERLP